MVELGDDVGDAAHDVHLVGDHDDGEAEVVAQLGEQVEDGAGAVRVEPGRRLVGEQHRGVEGQPAGDADPLALAAGEL
ncbi:hypothetical protein [Pimelobacter simplex]|uniref:hypothetical protein n=1 Tax=Nocardioides simplex TaxID=2045 RepID=UPI001C2094E1|nr:hypothetical protein [Pimelobacter simplex]